MNFNFKKLLTLRNLLISSAAIVSLVVIILVVKRFTGINQSGGNGDGDGDGAKIVLYFSPTCPHCKSVVEDWKTLESNHSNDSKLKVAKVNCNPQNDDQRKEQEAQEEQIDPDVEAFPTIILFVNGKKEIFNESDRSLETIENFISSKIN